MLRNAQAIYALDSARGAGDWDAALVASAGETASYASGVTAAGKLSATKLNTSSPVLPTLSSVVYSTTASGVSLSMLSTSGKVCVASASLSSVTAASCSVVTTSTLAKALSDDAEKLGSTNSGGGVSVPSGPSFTGAGTGYANAVIKDKPLAYYRMEGTNGTALSGVAVDSSGNGLNGTYSDVTAVTTKTGTGAYFSSTSSTSKGRIDIPNGFRATDGITMEAIVSADRRIDYAMIFALGSSNAITFQRYIGSDQLYTYASGSAGGAAAVSGLPFPQNQTIHVVSSIDKDGNVSLYLNGELKATGKTGAPAVSTDRTANMIGQDRYGGSTPSWAGTIDEAAIYSGPLSAAQVKAHYDAFAALP